MNEERNSMQLALAGWITRGVVRAWPKETQHWARAFRAELPEIERPGASLRWAIGGIIMLTRAWWNHLLRSWNRPAGVPEAGPLAELARNASRVPRTPRFVTALLLLASLTMLTVPDVREGLRATFHVWSAELTESGLSNRETTAKLRRLGDQNHDAQALALVAFLAEDHNERIQRADQAVALDPSLAWIYVYVRTTDVCCNGMKPQRWIDQLQKSDPDNAFVHFVAADQSWIEFDKRWLKDGFRGSFDEQAKDSLRIDKRWLAEMDAAAHLPKYDSYYSRPFDLYRAVARRYEIRDMDALESVVESLLFTFSAQRNARIYASLQYDQADAAQRSGNLAAAEQLDSGALKFAEKIAAQVHSNRERESWETIEGDALRQLQPLLVKMGKKGEAESANAQADANQANRLAWGPIRPWSSDENGWEGFMIRTFSVAVILLAVSSFAGLGFLFTRRRASIESRGVGSSLASIAVDYCPLLLLLSFTGLFVAYRPVALMYDQYMSWAYPVYDYSGLMHAWWTPFESPEGIGRISYSYLNAPTMWVAFIVALSMVAVFILVRGVLRKREATA